MISMSGSLLLPLRLSSNSPRRVGFSAQRRSSLDSRCSEQRNVVCGCMAPPADLRSDGFSATKYNVIPFFNFHVDAFLLEFVYIGFVDLCYCSAYARVSCTGLFYSMAYTHFIMLLMLVLGGLVIPILVLAII